MGIAVQRKSVQALQAVLAVARADTQFTQEDPFRLVRMQGRLKYSEDARDVHLLALYLPKDETLKANSITSWLNRAGCSIIRKCPASSQSSKRRLGKYS